MVICDKDLQQLTIDNIVDAMRINGIRQIDINPNKSEMSLDGPIDAQITEWYGSITHFNSRD